MLAALALWRQHPDAVVREQVAWSQRRWAEAARTA
jgi:hypothetical protein